MVGPLIVWMNWIIFLPEDKAAARDFLLEIKPLFPLIEIPAFWDDDEGIELIKHLSWYISATVVLADWTGSSTRFFPRVAHPMDIKGYWQKTLVQAQNALTVFPLKAKVAPFNGINTLFPFIENPTPLQQKVLDLDISQQGPQLFILEDVTGAGKTEAALILAHRLIAAGKAQGLIFWSANNGNGQCHVRSAGQNLACFLFARIPPQPGAGT